MTSQTGKQIITIQILPNTSRSNGNQKMKFGQFMFYSKTMQKRQVPVLFLFSKRALYKAKASGQDLTFNIFC